MGLAQKRLKLCGGRAWHTMRVCVIAALSLPLASCGDKEKVTALQSQVAQQGAEINDLRAQINRKNTDISNLTANLTKLAADLSAGRSQEGYYKGVVDANKDTLAASLKAVEACRTPQNVDAIATAIESLKTSCATTTSALDQLRPPKPADDHAPEQVPSPGTACTTQPNGAPCPLNPVTTDEPPTPGSGPGTEDKQSMEKTVLLAAAFVACEFYSAGTCTFVLAAVGMQLGMSPGQVRDESQQAYQKLKDKIDQRGVAIPNPMGGEPIILTPNAAAQILQANKAYRDLSDTDKRNPCKVIKVYQKVDVIDKFIGNLANPLMFRDKVQKENAKQAARQIDPSLAVWLDRIPYEGDGSKGLSCG